MKTVLVLSYVLAAAAVSANKESPAGEFDLVVPRVLEDVEGAEYADNTGRYAIRSQHLWPASEFDELPPGYNLITRLAIRPDGSGAEPIEFECADYEISMSTTERDELSPSFADNHGTDERLVRDGPATLRTDYAGPAGGPKDFDFILDLQEPFFYDPADGNLLIEVRSQRFGQLMLFDWQDVFEDSFVYTLSFDGAEGDLTLNGIPMQITFASTGLVAGDANQDLVFDQLDLVQVLQAGKYLTGLPATWGEGDWDGVPGGSPGNPPAGDGFFDHLDIITALAGGAYLNGPNAGLAVHTAASLDFVATPEPASGGLLTLGLLILVGHWCRARSVRSARVAV